MASLTICREFGGQDHKVCHCFHLFFFPPSICHEVMGSDAIGHSSALKERIPPTGLSWAGQTQSLVNSGRASFLQKKELLFLQWLLVYLHHRVHSPRGRWCSGPGEPVLALWRGPQKSFWTPRYKEDLNPQSFTFSFFISFIFKSEEAWMIH